MWACYAGLWCVSECVSCYVCLFATRTRCSRTCSCCSSSERCRQACRRRYSTQVNSSQTHTHTLCCDHSSTIWTLYKVCVCACAHAAILGQQQQQWKKWKEEQEEEEKEEEEQNVNIHYQLLMTSLPVSSSGADITLQSNSTHNASARPGRRSRQTLCSSPSSPLTYSIQVDDKKVFLFSLVLTKLSSVHQ